MPPKIRAFAISAMTEPKLLKERTTPGSASEGTMKELCSPKKCASTVAAAPRNRSARKDTRGGQAW